MGKKLYDIFISYSRKDIDKVLPIVKEIESKGISVWFDINGIESGEEFITKIVTAIDNSDSVLFMYTENSVNGQWTQKEVMYAKELGKTIVPILVEGEMPKKGWFKFFYGNVDCINITDSYQKEKLYDNLSNRFIAKKTPLILSSSQETIQIKSISSNKSTEPSISSGDESKIFVFHKSQLIAILCLFILTIIGLIAIELNQRNKQVAKTSYYQKENTEETKVEGSTKIIDREEIEEDNSSQIIPHNFILIPSGVLKKFQTDYYYDFADHSKSHPIYNDFEVDSFYIAQYELTQKEYLEIMPKPSDIVEGDSIPIYNLSNYDAISYCQKRSENEGYDGFYKIEDSCITIIFGGNGYRLPTHHEWAFAARQSNTAKATKYAAGDKLKEIAWYGPNSNNQPHQIGKKKPNGRKLYDMNGNVSELVHVNNNDIYITGNDYNQWEYGGRDFAEDFAAYFLGSNKITSKKKVHRTGMRLVFVPKFTNNDNLKFIIRKKNSH